MVCTCWYSLFRSCCKINNCSTNTTTPLTFIAVHSCRALRFRKWFHCKSKVRRLVFFSENKTNTIFYHYTQIAFMFGYCFFNLSWTHRKRGCYCSNTLYLTLTLFYWFVCPPSFLLTYCQNVDTIEIKCISANIHILRCSLQPADLIHSYILIND